MPRGGLKSSGGDWIVYSSALFFSFLLGNIASFMSAWLFLWHKSEMTNGTRWLLASKWHCEYQKDWSKTLLTTPLQTNTLTKTSLYCIYKESDISRLCSFCFSWSACFFADMFFSSVHQNSGDSFSSVNVRWQIVSSLNPKLKVDARPIYRDDETRSYCIDWSVQNPKLRFLFCPHFWKYCSFGDRPLECASFHCTVMLMIWIYGRLSHVSRNCQLQPNRDAYSPKLKAYNEMPQHQSTGTT